MERRIRFRDILPGDLFYVYDEFTKDWTESPMTALTCALPVSEKFIRRDDDKDNLWMYVTSISSKGEKIVVRWIDLPDEEVIVFRPSEHDIPQSGR